MFNFPVPLSYIKYRMLVYWYTAVGYLLPFEDHKDMLRCFGFNDEEIEVMEKTETHFMNSITVGSNSLSISNYAKETIDFSKLVEEHRILNRLNQLYEKENARLSSELDRLKSERV